MTRATPSSMRYVPSHIAVRLVVLAAAVCLISVAACEPSGPVIPSGSSTGVGIVNAFNAPVDLLVDGTLRASAIPTGHYSGIDATPGLHTVSVRQASGGAPVGVSMTVVSGRLGSLAATRGAGGALVAQSLEDTNAVVPAGATKLRVLHLAALTGEVQVWRTQPDFMTPIRWKFPFTYSAAISALSDPFFQSTPGTWNVRVWTDTLTRPPGDPAPWATPLDAVSVTLLTGQKKTVLILDKDGGGIVLQVID